MSIEKQNPRCPRCALGDGSAGFPLGALVRIKGEYWDDYEGTVVRKFKNHCYVAWLGMKPGLPDEHQQYTRLLRLPNVPDQQRGENHSKE